jgi:hypothetical protein
MKRVVSRPVKEPRPGAESRAGVDRNDDRPLKAFRAMYRDYVNRTAVGIDLAFNLSVVSPGPLPRHIADELL